MQMRPPEPARSSECPSDRRSAAHRAPAASCEIRLTVIRFAGTRPDTYVRLSQSHVSRETSGCALRLITCGAVGNVWTHGRRVFERKVSCESSATNDTQGRRHAGPGHRRHRYGAPSVLWSAGEAWLLLNARPGESTRDCAGTTPRGQRRRKPGMFHVKHAGPMVI